MFENKKSCKKCGRILVGQQQVACSKSCRDILRQRRVRKRRINNQECSKCGQVNDRSGMRTCSSCGIEGGKAHRNRRDKRRQDGLCWLCGKAEPREGMLSCADCSWKEIARTHKVSVELLDLLFDEQNGICPLTGRQLIKGINTSLDHIIPQSKNGATIKSNLRLVELYANRARSDKTDAEFKQLCRDVVGIVEFGG